jgi:hypothetical protein
LLCIEELDSLYKKPSFKVEIDKWMREEQGWIIYALPPSRLPPIKLVPSVS